LHQKSNYGRFLAAIAELLPEAEPGEVLRMALLLQHRAPDLLDHPEPQELAQQIRSISLQLDLYTDQHAAIAEELDALASTSPCQFSPQHLWTLVRAIKVQSQYLGIYLGPPAKSLSGSALPADGLPAHTLPGSLPAAN
jgi:hypothetical protein